MMLVKWNKTKSPLTGAVEYVTEDGRYKLCAGWGGEPLIRRWTLYRVSERAVPRRWVESCRDYDEDRDEIVEYPGYWAGPYKEPENTWLAKWPDSPNGPTRRASEWLISNEKDEVSQ